MRGKGKPGQDLGHRELFARSVASLTKKSRYQGWYRSEECAPSLRLWIPPPACYIYIKYSASSYIKYIILFKLFTLPFKVCSKVRSTSPMLSISPCASDLLREGIVSTLCLAKWEILPSSHFLAGMTPLSCHCRPLPNRAPPILLPSHPYWMELSTCHPPRGVLSPPEGSQNSWVMLLRLRVWELPQHWPLSSPSGTGDLYFTSVIFQLPKASDCHYTWTPQLQSSREPVFPRIPDSPQERRLSEVLGEGWKAQGRIILGAMWRDRKDATPCPSRDPNGSVPG